MGHMKGMTVLEHFPTYVHAGLTTSVVGPMFENCTITLKPIYEKGFFIHALLINKTKFVCTGTGFGADLESCLLLMNGIKMYSIPSYISQQLQGKE